MEGAVRFAIESALAYLLMPEGARIPPWLPID
jgi:hypothetical protein